MSEFKSLSLHEFKDISEDKDKRKFEGYLSVFGNVDSYGDVVEKGAFKEAVTDLKRRGKYIPILENHAGWASISTDLTPVGFYEKMEEDDHGLKVVGHLFSEGRGAVLYSNMKEAPDGFFGLSIGYSATSISQDQEECRIYGKDCKKIIKKVKLMEGSTTAFPANPATWVTSVKSSPIEFTRNFEAHLKGKGYSGNESKAIASIAKNYFSSIEEKQLADVEDIQEKKDAQYEDVDQKLAEIKNVCQEIKEYFSVINQLKKVATEM